MQFFAENGYVIIKGAVALSTISALNNIVDARLRHEPGGGHAKHLATGFQKFDFSAGGPFLRSGLQPTVVRIPRGDAEKPPPATRREKLRTVGWPAGALSLGPFRELIEPPAVAALLAELLGDPRWV